MLIYLLDPRSGRRGKQNRHHPAKFPVAGICCKASTTAIRMDNPSPTYVTD
jgi:hypothetical protein